MSDSIQNIEVLKKDLPENLELFILSSSFDRRWSAVAEYISLKDVRDVVILEDKNSPLDQNEILNSALVSVSKSINLRDKGSFDIWKLLALELIPLIEECNGAVLMDITALDHEILLFFVSQLKNKCLFGKVVFTYVGAESYGVSKSNGNFWLSRGVKSIRSVLGYPGGLIPSKSSHHLIILVGFELDRAKELILSYEPSSISLGIGKEPYSDNFLEKNEKSRNELRAFINTLGIVYKNISEFSFSCSSVSDAKYAILSEAKKYSDSNITISPMNTKISTIATGLAAIENDEIKVCYVEPLELNKENYSEVSRRLTLFSLSAMV